DESATSDALLCEVFRCQEDGSHAGSFSQGLPRNTLMVRQSSRRRQQCAPLGANARPSELLQCTSGPGYPAILTNFLRPTWTTRPTSLPRGTSRAASRTGSPSILTPPCSICLRASECELASPSSVSNLGNQMVGSPASPGGSCTSRTVRGISCRRWTR